MKKKIILPDIRDNVRRPRSIASFERSMIEIILALEEKTGLPLREMQAGEWVKKTRERKNSQVIRELPEQYSFLFVSNVDPNRQFKLNFYVKGKMGTRLFWKDESNGKKRQEDFSVESLLDYARKIREHLNPE